MVFAAITSNEFEIHKKKFPQEFVIDVYQTKFNKFSLERDYEMLQQLFYCNLLIHSIENICWGILKVKFS